MALAPRSSSLRSLVLLMSHGKPRLNSFFSSSAATGVPPAAPGADAPPASPAVQPPAPPGRSCPKLPVEGEFVLHPIHGGPRPRGAVKGVTNKVCLNAPEDPSSAYTTPGYGSCSTPHKHPCGASEDVKPPPARGGGGHRVVDPPRRDRGRGAVPDEPEQCAQEHPKYPVPDSSSDEVFSSCSSAVPPPCTPAAPDPEDPSSAYTTPGYGSCSTPHKHPCGASEDVKPPPARGGGGHRVVDPPRRGRGRRAVPDEPAQCAQEHPKYPVPDSSTDEVFSSCSSAVPPPCTPAAPDVQPPGTPALPDRSGHKLPDHEESVVDPLRDPPPRNRLNPAIEQPAQCTLDNPKYPTPDHGSCSPSEGASGGDLLEDPWHQVRDPPRRP